MRTVSFQGTALSAGQRRQLAIQQQARAVVSTASVDWDTLRTNVDSRLFVGPPTPRHLLRDLQPDREAQRYWRLVDEFKRYGRVETNEPGTPWVGDAWEGY